MTKHHPMRAGGRNVCGSPEHHEVHYPEDNVTEALELRKVQWRHITSTVKTSYRGTVIRSSIEEGLQVHLDGGVSGRENRTIRLLTV